MKSSYQQVLEYLIGDNGPNMFKGIYDARNGNPAFMYGIETVIECIAAMVDEETQQKFTDMFISNMIKSAEKVSVYDETLSED